MADEEREIIVSFDYYGDSMVLSEDEDDDHAPGAHPGEARVEVDPLVQAFARSPYDPMIGYMMMGRATGEVIANPPRIPWMRVIAYVLAIGLVIPFLSSLYFLFDRGGFVGWIYSSWTVVDILLAVGGFILLWRLLRGSGS